MNVFLLIETSFYNDETMVYGIFSTHDKAAEAQKHAPKAIIIKYQLDQLAFQSDQKAKR